MSPQAVVDIVEAIKPELWVMFFKFVGVAVILLILRNIFGNLAAYFMFRTNKHLGKNVRLRFKKRDAIIVDYDWRFIHLKFLDTNTEGLIHITLWPRQKWEVYKNGFHQKKGKKKSEDD